MEPSDWAVPVAGETGGQPCPCLTGLRKKQQMTKHDLNCRKHQFYPRKIDCSCSMSFYHWASSGTEASVWVQAGCWASWACLHQSWAPCESGSPPAGERAGRREHLRRVRPRYRQDRDPVRPNRPVAYLHGNRYYPSLL